MDDHPFRDLLDRPFRWPRRGDEPLRKATKIQHQAELSVDARERSVLLQSGFMRAGKLLVEMIGGETIRGIRRLPCTLVMRQSTRR